MIYHDAHCYKLPKHMLWSRIDLPIGLSVTKPEGWCNKHKSKGRFYRRYQTVYHPDGEQSRTTLWYFEFAEDAIMFALKWK